MNFINLTPHDVMIVDDDGNETHRYSRSSDIVRLATRELTNISKDAENGVKLVHFGDLQDAPPRPETPATSCPSRPRSQSSDRTSSSRTTKSVTMQAASSDAGHSQG